MAPSTPPPPSREELAALTIASVDWSVMSPMSSSRAAFVPMRYRKLEAMLFVGQRFHARQLLAFKKLQGRTAAGGDMSHLVRQPGLMHRSDGIPAAHDRDSAAVGGDGLGNLHGALDKRRNLKDAHRAVPDDGFRGGNLFRKRRYGLRNDIEAYLAVRNTQVSFDHLGLGRGINRFRDNVISGQQQADAFALRFLDQGFGQLELVVFHQRFAHAFALGLEEGISHGSADEQRVDLGEKIADHVNLVGNLGAADDRDERLL